MYQAECPVSLPQFRRFMRLFLQTCPTHADEISLGEFAALLGWTLPAAERVAVWATENGLVESNLDFGGRITVLEGISGT